VAAGESLRLVDRRCAGWAIAHVNEVTYAPRARRDAAAVRALADCELLAPSWRAALQDR